jgi:acyl-ACP thioesterase
MDPNGHINNTTYLAWALETLPQEVLDTHHLKEVRGEPARQQRKGGGAEAGSRREGEAGSRRGGGRQQEGPGAL